MTAIKSKIMAGSTRLRRCLGGVALAFIVGTLATCWHYRVWSLADWRAYDGMSRESHFVWQDMHWRRIHQGQSVEEVLELTKPTRVDRFNGYVDLHYEKNSMADGLSFSSLEIIAQDDRLMVAQAEGCTWRHLFFDGWSKPEWKAFTDQRTVYLHSRIKTVQLE